MGIMNYGLREKYEQLNKFGDRLSGMKNVSTECLNPATGSLFLNHQNL